MRLFEAIKDASHRAVAGEANARLHPAEYADALPVVALPFVDCGVAGEKRRGATADQDTSRVQGHGHSRQRPGVRRPSGAFARACGNKWTKPSFAPGMRKS